MSDTPMLALSVRQPWAWLIVNGHKDIENRMWPTRVRGRVLIHASATVRQSSFWNAYDLAHDLVYPKLADSIPPLQCLPLGMIVGSVEIVDCVESHESPWFEGRYGLVLRNPAVLPHRPCRGALKFFRPQYSDEEVVTP